MKRTVSQFPRKIRWQNRITDNLTSDTKAYYSGYGSGIDYYTYSWVHKEDNGSHLDGSIEDNGEVISKT